MKDSDPLALTTYVAAQLDARKIAFLQSYAPRGRDQLDRRPPSPDEPRQLQAVHRSRHLNVGEHYMDVRPDFQNGNCFVGTVGIKRDVTGCALSRDRVYPNEEVIFDNQDDRPICACTGLKAARQPGATAEVNAEGSSLESFIAIERAVSPGVDGRLVFG